MTVNKLEYPLSVSSTPHQCGGGCGVYDGYMMVTYLIPSGGCVMVIVLAFDGNSHGELGFSTGAG